MASHPHLPQTISLPQAAQELGVSVADLRARIDAGTISAVETPDGEIVVLLRNGNNTTKTEDINAKLSAISRDDFAHLRGQVITVSEAAKKYKVPRNTILEWADRYIRVISPGYRMEIDEEELAFCVAVYRVRKMIGVRTGAPLLDEEGKPYLLKHPALSRYRREYQNT